MSLDGVELGAIDEAAAGKLGIGIVHQEGSLVPHAFDRRQRVRGAPADRLPRPDRRAREWWHGRPLSWPSSASTSTRARRVSELSSAQAQVVEIAKALSQDLRLLILDEPTAALTLTETDRLFDVLRRLKANGVSIIYVSHRLAEIFAVCDRVTVLKDGRLTGTRDVAATDTDELIRLMVGRDVHFARAEQEGSPGRGPARGRAISRPPRSSRDASLTVRAGEIVCLAGLVGSGRSETCEAIFGARAVTAGTSWSTAGPCASQARGTPWRPASAWCPRTARRAASS